VVAPRELGLIFVWIVLEPGVSQVAAQLGSGHANVYRALDGSPPPKLAV
jgi:DNA-binding phage protein